MQPKVGSHGNVALLEQSMYVRAQQKPVADFVGNCTGCFHVRRTVKAAASFSNKKTAHYLCLIEVFRERPQRLPAI